MQDGLFAGQADLRTFMTDSSAGVFVLVQNFVNIRDCLPVFILPLLKAAILWMFLAIIYARRDNLFFVQRPGNLAGRLSSQRHIKDTAHYSSRFFVDCQLVADRGVKFEAMLSIKAGKKYMDD
ncbi:MAG: hypothetical protein LUF91_04595 [Oscillospiraceae bacterium]|nr:hypothetical protein [Oscillospiraceae bacterium]